MFLFIPFTTTTASIHNTPESIVEPPIQFQIGGFDEDGTLIPTPT
jgi:hypothetical protein